MAGDIESEAPILEQASRWWALLNSESASCSDHREFGEWVGRSPERVAAYLQTARLVKALKSPQLTWPSTTAEALIREARTSSTRVLPFSSRQVTNRVDQGVHRRFPWRFSGAMVAVLLMGIGLSLFVLQMPTELKTGLGEQRSVLLDDGSRVTLNTASTIQVELRKAHRRVHLIQGEALFEIAHDAGRPFEVQVRNAVLIDVGTQFNVDMRPNGTTVTVIDGRVAIASVDSADSAGARAGHGVPATTRESLTLGPRDRLVITTSGLGAPQHDTNVASSLAWTRRELMFERRPLGEVAKEFNRYNRDRIDIDSPELERQEVTGIFEAKDPASFLAFLSSVPNVEIREAPDGDHIVAIRNGATHPGSR
jgi:transmembrane sensor